MIELLDRALAAIVRERITDGSAVEVSFDAPNKEWASKQSAPVLNVYLYDIREDLERRDVAYEEIRDAEGRVVSRRPPPRRFALSYLLTAWTQRPEDEHRLLSATLSTFLRFDTLPADSLEGALAEQGLPVYSKIAMPPADERSISDLWTALGGELKPSLDLVLIVPFDLSRAVDAPPAVIEPPRVALAAMKRAR